MDLDLDLVIRESDFAWVVKHIKDLFIDQVDLIVIVNKVLNMMEEHLSFNVRLVRNNEKEFLYGKHGFHNVVVTL